MSDAAAFLDAIRDAPDDDAHRLVYADWLDEHGRAEPAAFLRAHVALARFHGWGDDPFDRKGELDVLDLRPALRDELLAPFAPLARDLPAPGEVEPARRLSLAYRLMAHRGLIETVYVGNQLGLTLLMHQPGLFAQLAVRFVSLSRVPWWLPAEVRPDLAAISEAGLESFLSSAVLEHLEAIDLRTFYLGEPQVAALVRHTKPLRRLRTRIYVRGGPMHPQALGRRLAEAFGPQLIAVPPISDRAEIYGDDIPF